MALIRMCVVPNCSQQLSRPVLWIVAVCATYWTHTTAVDVRLCLNGSLTGLYYLDIIFYLWLYMQSLIV